MSVSGLEATADGIMQFEGWFNHDRGIPAMSYRNRNPGNIEQMGKKVVYPSLVDGYAALLRDLRDKFTGNNVHGLGPDSKLSDLMAIYAPAGDSNPVVAYTHFVANWITLATGKETTPDTRLGDIWTGGTLDA